MNYLNRCWKLLFLLQIYACCTYGATLTPLEANGFQQLPTSAQINQFLQNMVQQSPQAKLITLGQSAGGRDITALLISSNPQFLANGEHEDNKLTVLLIGSQHGTEPSGNEGLQKLAVQFVTGKLNQFLKNMNLIIIVNGNPDGRDNTSRFNERKGNLNVDFIRLAYPESLIYLDVLNKYQVDTLLDLHESSILKKILALNQGYLLEVDAQYEVGNNPNIDKNLLSYSQQVLLPELIKITEKNGLPSIHYHGEILRLNQEVGHGGLKISNLRNYSALQGIFSVLVENRLDPSEGVYPTPGNIKVRSEKQLISAISYLTLLNNYKNPILQKVKAAKKSWETTPFNQSVSKLSYKYNLNTQNPLVSVNLKKISTGKLVSLDFPRFDFIDVEKTLLMPEAYAIKASQKRMVNLLKKHHIRVEELQKSKKILAIMPKLKSVIFNYGQDTEFRPNVNIEANYKPVFLTLEKGDFLVSTRQPNGKLVPLLLDLRSTDSVYPYLNFGPLLIDNRIIPSFPVKLLK